MFTGLVEETGRIERLQPSGAGVQLLIEAHKVLDKTQVGDSISVDGCCLTATEIKGNHVAFEAGPETLSRTTLHRKQVGDLVNLERSIRPSDRLGGHLVTGHVDGQGQLVDRIDQQEWSEFWISVPSQLVRQMASKGSVTVDGVSLTLVDVLDDRFSVALIPHTLNHTTLGQRKPRDHLNIETDLLAKYVEQQMLWLRRDGAS